MRFYEKLDLLMNITATTNVLLSRKINLDPSYISRLRRGERKPIKDRLVIETMASHFAKNASLEYQIELLSDMIYPEYKNMDEQERITILADWLYDKGMHIEDEGLTKKKASKTKTSKTATKGSGATPKTSDRTYSGIYYGLEGKRQATLRFLATTIKNKETNPILFFDDADSSWLVEDSDFRQKVQKGLKAAIEKGHKVVIIHNIKRPLNEMIKAIELWMPLHYSGMTEAYYYPKVRDDLFKRTLCVVPDTVAIVSSSIEEEDDGTANFFVQGSLTVKSFESEFMQLLRRCVPLFEVYQTNERKKFFNFIEEFDESKGSTIYNLENLSLMTMPEEVRDQIMGRTGKDDDKHYAKTHQKRKETFEEKLNHEKYYEIIYNRSARDLLDGKVQLAHSNFSHGHPIYYTRDEYIAHLENYIVLAQKYENFHFVLQEKENTSLMPVYLKEGTGAIMISPDGGSILIRVKESSLVAALYDYLRYSTVLGKYNDADKNKQIDKIKAHISKIKK